MRKIYRDIEQCTDEWFALRCGIITCSEMKNVLRGSGADSKTRRTYMLKLIGERLTGHPAESHSSPHMERGKLFEDEARQLYCLTTGNEVETIGFIKGYEYGRESGEIGYSPDGMIVDGGLLEIKTKLPHLHLDCLLRDEVPAEHIAQIQGGLWVAEEEWLDFVSYWPGLPIFIKRVERDEKKIKEMEAACAQFYEEMHAIIEKINK